MFIAEIYLNISSRFLLLCLTFSSEL